MDITRDQKSKKRKSELGLEKSSPAKVSKGSKSAEGVSTIINNEIVTMTADLFSLPEADYEDPAIKSMVEEDHKQTLKKFGLLTSEDVEEIARSKEEILKNFPTLSSNEAAARAWQKIKKTRLNNLL